MKTYQILLSLLFIGISFIACEKENSANSNQEIIKESAVDTWNSIMIAEAKDITQKLKGSWEIESIEAEFQDSYFNSQVGIQTDTTLLNFGQVNFTEWTLLHGAYPDSTSYKGDARLIYDNEEFTISFNYLLHIPAESKVLSFVDKSIQENHNWDTANGRYLDNIGILDNVEIIQISPNEFHMVGLNRGIKKMILKRK